MLNEEIARQLKEADRFQSISREDYRNRDKARKELLEIERDLKAQFEQHSHRFVDLFRTHAEEFIGLRVDIELDHQKGRNETGFVLLLSMEDQVRSVSVDVSESQRFFLDIALRMALAEFMSETAATLIIDTPEGSLDISYEARAGQMFSNFADRGNFLLITANLRSSALLKRLAEKQKKKGMQIERMTDWTDLSEVQREEEELFAIAYDEIEKAPSMSLDGPSSAAAYADVVLLIGLAPSSLTPISVPELHLYAYLGNLIAFSEGQPASDWGYRFSVTREGVPYSQDLEMARRNLVENLAEDIACKRSELADRCSPPCGQPVAGNGDKHIARTCW